MDDRLLATVSRRLDDSNLDDDAGLLVLAACESDEALVETVAGNPPELSQPATADDRKLEPAGAYLASITAEGFRGVGETRTLDLNPGPGLTLVVGRNGSGKSSFVEALEVLLTGDSRRWTTRKEKVWREGWRNLHHPHPASVRATFAIDGIVGITTIARGWNAGADLGDASTTSQAQGKRKAPLEALGWDAALVANRPILSYNELGSMLDEGPSHLYDALAGILGLDDVAAAVERLRATRLNLGKVVKAARDEANALARALDEIDDERAELCLSAIQGSRWDLDTVASVVTGTSDQSDARSDLELLLGFSQLAGPDPEMVATAAERAHQAAADRDAVAGTDAEAADRTANLLRAALVHHHHSGDEPCPVCGRGTLNRVWATETDAEVERLDRTAREVRRVAQAERDAHQRLRSLQALPTVPLTEATRLRLDADATRRCWEQWLEIPTNDLRDAAHALKGSFRR